MELVKLGKKGHLTIPKSTLRAAGITDETPLLEESVGDGAIVLRQAAVYPIERHIEERIRAPRTACPMPWRPSAAT